LLSSEVQASYNRVFSFLLLVHQAHAHLASLAPIAQGTRSLAPFNKLRLELLSVIGSLKFYLMDAVINALWRALWFAFFSFSR
jgi:hypothetical protein